MKHLSIYLTILLVLQTLLMLFAFQAVRHDAKLILNGQKIERDIGHRLEQNFRGK